MNTRIGTLWNMVALPTPSGVSSNGKPVEPRRYTPSQTKSLTQQQPVAAWKIAATVIAAGYVIGISSDSSTFIFFIGR